MINRLLLAVTLALATSLGASPASAQPAEAMGRPLPDASLKDGTVTVRLVAGERTRSAPGVEVTLTATPTAGAAGATVKRARTDAEGRATFTDIGAGDRVKLTAPGAEGEVSSSEFPMPVSGGVRLILSTVPMAGGAGAMAGRPPMSPRAMTGQARPEAADAGDTLTVRLSYDDFADADPPVGQPVMLVGYRFDQTVSGRMVPTDAGARAVFDGLDRRGATSYFALTLLPHGDGHDRLISPPLLMNQDVGQRLILSGEKRDRPPVDDLGTVDPQPEGGVPPGQVDVNIMIDDTMEGAVPFGSEVELLDGLTGEPVVVGRTRPPFPIPSTIEGQWTGADATALAAGTLAVTVTLGGRPLPGVQVIARPAAAAPASDAAPATGAAPRPAPPAPATAESPLATATSAGDGVATLTGLPIDTPLDVVVSLAAIDVVVPPHTVTLPATGGHTETVDVRWQSRGQAAARLTGVPGGPDKVYVARGRWQGQTFLSAPFQLAPGRGAAISLVVVRRIAMTFALDGFVNDVHLGVRGSFGIRNASWAPYVPGTRDQPEELVVPLPRGAVGATVRQDFAEIVGTDPGRGFVIRRPLPPGGLEFIAGFSLRIDDGETVWNMPLPLGVTGASLAFNRNNNNMRLELPAGTRAREVNERGSRFYVLNPIDIAPGQSMRFTIAGLPEMPRWRWWVPRIVGGVVLILLGAMLWLSLRRPAAATVETPVRFDALLDELTELEQSGGDPERRASLMAALEEAYRQGGAPPAR